MRVPQSVKLGPGITIFCKSVLSTIPLRQDVVSNEDILRVRGLLYDE